MKARIISGLAMLWGHISNVWYPVVVGIFIYLMFTYVLLEPTVPIPKPLLLGLTILLLLLVGLTVSSYIAHRNQMRAIQKQATVSYHERIRQLTKSLNDTSANVDSILGEMAQIVQEREKAVIILEGRQTKVQRYIERLEKGPAETLKIYEEILAEQARQQDKENKKLAQKYFIYGSLVTLLVGIVFALPPLLLR